MARSPARSRSTGRKPAARLANGTAQPMPNSLSNPTYAITVFTGGVTLTSRKECPPVESRLYASRNSVMPALEMYSSPAQSTVVARLRPRKTSRTRGSSAAWKRPETITKPSASTRISNILGFGGLARLGPLHLRGVAGEVARFRVHDQLGPAHGHRRLAEPGGDELQLARVADEVAGREHARQVRLHLLAHLERVALDREPPGLEGPKIGDEAEVHDHVVHRHRGLFLVAVVVDDRALDLAVALERLELVERHHAAAGGVELVDAVFMSAELVAPMDERQLRGERLQVQRPVDRRVAAAQQQHATVAEDVEPGEHVVEAVALEARERGVGQLARREVADAGGQDHGLGLVLLSAVAADQPAAVDLGQVRRLLAQAHGGAVLHPLRDQVVHQVARLD